MLKKGTFINKKYYKLFAGSLLGTLANGLNVMLDSILSGNQLGETALTAVSIVSPLIYIIFFTCAIYTPGYGIIYGKYNGDFDKENSERTAGQSIITAAIVGILK